MPSLYRILYLYPGPTPPPIKQEWDKHWHLSRVAEGDILLPVWWQNAEEQNKAFPPERHKVGNFHYHVYRFFAPPRILRGLAQFWFYLTTGLRLCRKRKYDFIVCYGANIPGLAALVLKMFTAAELIVEISGVPDKAYLYEHRGHQQGASSKKLFADFLLQFCLRRARRIRLLFPAQLDGYPKLKAIPRSVFHEFVPVRSLEPSSVDEKYILFIGHPWYLKGVDVLINAYRLIAPKYPQHRLKIVGWCTDRSPFEKLAAGLNGVEFSKGVSYIEALELMRKCSVFVLPSRTEAMGRVLLEAMALGKPLVASRVDGIPFIITDNQNGLLFSSEDVAELAQKLDLLLGDEALSARLTANGLACVQQKLDDETFVAAFEQMLKDSQEDVNASEKGTAE